MYYLLTFNISFPNEISAISSISISAEFSDVFTQTYYNIKSSIFNTNYSTEAMELYQKSRSLFELKTPSALLYHKCESYNNNNTNTINVFHPGFRNTNINYIKLYKILIYSSPLILLSTISLFSSLNSVILSFDSYIINSKKIITI